MMAVRQPREESNFTFSAASTVNVVPEEQRLRGGSIHTCVTFRHSTSFLCAVDLDSHILKVYYWRWLLPVKQSEVLPQAPKNCLSSLFLIFDIPLSHLDRSQSRFLGASGLLSKIPGFYSSISLRSPIDHPQTGVHGVFPCEMQSRLVCMYCTMLTTLTQAEKHA